jgi:hypothetical protein
MTKRLHQHEAVEQEAGAPRPILRLENDIAVEPYDLAAAVRQNTQSDVQEPFLLPHDVLAARANEYVRFPRNWTSPSQLRQVNGKAFEIDE